MSGRMSYNYVPMDHPAASPTGNASGCVSSSDYPHHHNPHPHPHPHHHHLYHSCDPTNAVVLAPPAPSTVPSATLPGTYVEQAWATPHLLPDQWTSLDGAFTGSDDHQINELCATVAPGRTFWRAQWACRPGVTLVRGDLPGEPPVYIFVRESESAPGTFETVGAGAYSEEALPRPPGHVLTCGMYDAVTATGKRGWGLSLVELAGAAPRLDVFRPPSLHFLLPAEGAEHGVSRTLRVIGTPAAAGLDVEVAPMGPGGAGEPVTGKVGKLLDVTPLRGACVVRVVGVPPGPACAFHGVEVAYSHYHHG